MPMMQCCIHTWDIAAYPKLANAAWNPTIIDVATPSLDDRSLLETETKLNEAAENNGVSSSTGFSISVSSYHSELLVVLFSS